MKILIFNWRDVKNPVAGGAEVFTHEVAKRWASQGHKVTLFTAAFPNGKREELRDGVKIIRNGGKYSVYQRAKNYYKKHSKDNYDIVIDEINTRPFLTPKFVNNGEKILAFIHQLAREFWFYETFFPLNFIGYHLLEPRWLKNYIHIPTVTVSNSTKEDLLKLGFNKVFIVPEGISFKPLDDLPEKEKEPALIFVGRLKRAKMPDHVLKAFKIVKEKFPNSKLWVVGNGYLKGRLEKMVFDGIKFFGYLPFTEKLKLMSRTHAIIVPGVREGWGLVVTEANAMGTPAIGYNIPGLRDSIRDGETGLLCPPDPNSLAKSIIKFLSDKNLQKVLSKNALRWATHFSWGKSAQKFEEILEKTVDGHYD